MGHYGLRSTVGLVAEKLFIDPVRFSAKKKRTLPSFPEGYKKAEIGESEKRDTPYTVLYALHYFYPLKKGGTERFTLNIAKEAVSRGNAAKVLVLEANEAESEYTGKLGNILYRYYEYEGIRCIGFRHKKAPLGLYYKCVTLDDPDMRSFMHFIIDSEKIDLVHATYPQPFAPFLDECRECGVPYVVTCTDFAMMCHYSTMVDKRGDFCGGTEGGEKCKAVCKTYGCKDFKARHDAAERVLFGASIVTVPSEFVARLIGREFGGLGILPVNHGISDSFAMREGRESVKRFVYAGTVSQLKGIHLLIEAFGRLVGDDLSLLIYGSGDDKYEAALRKKADSRVRFMGAAPAEKMPEIYSEADCVIIPSMWYETYNFVLREAAQTGALVIAADIGAMSEAIREGENGFLFEPASADALYEKMKLALDFDFKNYKPVSYPKTRDEGDTYDRIYRAALDGKK